MSIPKFLINSFINDYKGNNIQLCKDLYKQGILTKQYNDENLILLYNKYEDINMSELKRECRSLVLDNTTFKIVAYSCETPRLVTIPNTNKIIIHESYEGTMLSIFYHLNKWYVSTRRCLDSNKSIFEVNEVKSHYQMFDEVLQKTEYNNFENFSQILDKNKSYYFVLIHHENKHIIDYTCKFGDNYTFICLVSIRDSDMNELDINNEIFMNKFIFIPKTLNSLEEFTMLNKNKYDMTPDNEGIIIKVFSPEFNKYNLYKLQTDNYKFALVIGNSKNMYKGLIYLYQTNKLIDYFNDNPNNNLVKMNNPLNMTESFFTIGVIDSTFKVCTSELFELFKILWSLKTGKGQNKELYELLPKEYKDIMYGIRGIYYKKKASLFENTNKKSVEEFKNTHLKITDIYNFLKGIPVDTFMEFLKARKLMCNWVIINPVLEGFNKISVLCNYTHLKQCFIFTHKLYPDINITDIPTQIILK